MKKVSLYNKTGQKLTEVNIRTNEEPIDGVQWGGKTFIYQIEDGNYIEANIVPAILVK
jgi:hypothetical protein